MDSALKKIIALSGILLLFYLHQSRGFIHPDSLFQVLEPAHIMVYGYGLVPWEYEAGVRPALPVAAAAILMDIQDKTLGYNPGRLTSILDISSAACLLLIIVITTRFGRIHYSKKAGDYAGLFCGSSAILLFWGSRFSPDIFATLFATTSYYLALTGRGVRKTLLAGASMGMGFIIMYRSGVLLIPLTAYLLLKEREKAVYFTAGFLVFALLQGFIDLAAYGSFLHSPISFVMQNIGGNMDYFGSQHSLYNLLAFILHLPAFYACIYCLRGDRKDIIPASLLFFTVFYSLIGHKQVRYMVPALPFFMLCAGAGLERFTRELGEYEGKAAAGFIAMAVFTAFIIPHGFMGYGTDDPERAMRYVSRQKDLEGLAYTGIWSWGYGSYFLLHRESPTVYVKDGLTLTPGLQEEDCRKNGMHPGHIGYQCTGWETIRKSPVNYLIIHDYGENTSAPDYFRKEAEFGRAAVYKRS